MRFRRFSVLAAAFAILSTLLPSATISASPALPDLGMGHLRDFTIGTTPSGHKRLRFTTKIISIGDGPFEAFGHNPQPNGTKLVNQRIRDFDGNVVSSLPTVYRMYFAGDGHTHWHLRDLESYVLQNTSHTQIRRGAKHGFCFADRSDYQLTLPHSPQNPVYTGCGDLPDVNIKMGLSVGWADTYGWTLVGQWIDITGLPNGTYTVRATADSLRDFRERCENNNSTTATIQITGTTVTIVSPGRNSKPC